MLFIQPKMYQILGNVLVIWKKYSQCQISENIPCPVQTNFYDYCFLETFNHYIIIVSSSRKTGIGVAVENACIFFDRAFSI